MSAFSLSNWLNDRRTERWPRLAAQSTARRPTLFDLAHLDERQLPRFVRESAVALRYLRLLGPLDWHHFPDRPDQRFCPDCPPLSHATVAAAYLVKIDQHLPYAADLCAYLLEHPALAWILGFPLAPPSVTSGGLDLRACLPTQRHFNRLLRAIPNTSLQFLLDDTIRLITEALVGEVPDLGDCIALDTKHVIAWVKENNPKAYVKDRYDKTKQPTGDPDCRLGCKRKHNQVKGKEGVESLPTPTTNPVPAKHLAVGEYYWGYGSGVVTTKIDGWGEIVLSELTQPFNHADVSYFTPLMADVERRLGHRPRVGAFDAAFDACPIYEYFADAGGFAAVPFVARGGRGKRSFDEHGTPLCPAGLSMTLRYRFQARQALIVHEKGRYACPLLYPQPTGQPCPVDHKNWAKNGCVTTLASGQGARLRHQIDRDSAEYKQVYKQRTTVERINSQAVDLGIERPKLRNGQSIANHNTLTYVLINLHALQRVRQRLAKRSQDGTAQERA